MNDDVDDVRMRLRVDPDRFTWLGSPTGAFLAKAVFYHCPG